MANTGSHRMLADNRATTRDQHHRSPEDYVGESEARGAGAKSAERSAAHVKVPDRGVFIRVLSVAGFGATAGAVMSVLVWVWDVSAWKKSVEERQAAVASEVAELKSSGTRRGEHDLRVERDIGALLSKVDTLSSRVDESLRIQRELLSVGHARGRR